MSDDRIPKVLVYSQLDSGQRTVGRPWLRYKDKLKRNLSPSNVLHTNFERVVLDRNNGRYLCQGGVSDFEISRIDQLRDERQRRKVSANIPVAMS